ncbi:MAG: hypothetical protein KKA84_00910 [Bacteroidetes bacterium]|nr:hypothetical protein [Bacteroidota bacterium]
MKKIISQNQHDIAFVVGNGINRYVNFDGSLSWEELLNKLWYKFAQKKFSSTPAGLAITEFYDLLDLFLSKSTAQSYPIKRELCTLLHGWEGLPHHKWIVDSISKLNAPLLTLNFDTSLLEDNNVQQYYFDSGRFTDFYPWNTYYAIKQMRSPIDGFGIWFINGFIKYHRSIRLGLSDYMGCVQRARQMIHNKDDRRLFSGKNFENWQGKNTYLHILFNKSLMIFGLALEENEVFLRWLLLERARYFREFPKRKKKGWYVTTIPEKEDRRYQGKKFFLESVGFNIIEVSSYDEIYKNSWV